MISAVITHLDDEQRLGATLASLAAAAIDGLVREALVVDVRASEAVLAAADDAGARPISATDEAQGLAAACAAGRGDWLLILRCGTRLEAGWESAARRHIGQRPQRAGWFDLALDRDGAGARMAEAVANLGAAWFGRLDPRQGLLVPKGLYDPTDPNRPRSRAPLRRLKVRGLV